MNCSFCNKYYPGLTGVIAGPNVFICYECVELIVLAIRKKDPSFCIEDLK